MPSPLSDAHIEGERRLRLIVGQAIERIWRDLPGYDRENVDEWLSTVLPVVGAGQRASISLTEGYVARASERQPLGVDVEAILASVRNGTPPEVAYERPFIGLWAKLGDGLPFVDASAAALARAQGMAAFDVQGAMARTAQTIGRDDSQIQRWRRVADGRACAFCRAVDGAILNSGDAMPLHPHCGCGIEPLTEQQPVSALPGGVVVEDHGELGALLTDPSHDFTAAADALS